MKELKEFKNKRGGWGVDRGLGVAGGVDGGGWSKIPLLQKCKYTLIF